MCNWKVCNKNNISYTPLTRHGSGMLQFVLFDRVPKYAFGHETDRQGRYGPQNSCKFDVSATRIQWKTSRTRIWSEIRKQMKTLFCLPEHSWVLTLLMMKFMLWEAQIIDSTLVSSPFVLLFAQALSEWAASSKSTSPGYYLGLCNL